MVKGQENRTLNCDVLVQRGILIFRPLWFSYKELNKVKNKEKKSHRRCSLFGVYQKQKNNNNIPLILLSKEKKEKKKTLSFNAIL